MKDVKGGYRKCKKGKLDTEQGDVQEDSELYTEEDMYEQPEGDDEDEDERK